MSLESNDQESWSQPQLPRIKAPPGYKPVFHDMQGLSASEYRTRGRVKIEADSPTDAAIQAHYKISKNYSATAEYFGITVYYVRKSIKRARRLKSV